MTDRAISTLLADEAIDTCIAHSADAPSELSLVHLYPIDGAVHRVARVNQNIVPAGS